MCAERTQPDLISFPCAARALLAGLAETSCVLSLGCGSAKGLLLHPQEHFFKVMERCQELGMTGNLIYSLQKARRMRNLSGFKSIMTHPQAVGEPGGPQPHEQSGLIPANLHIPTKSDCSNSPLPSVLYNSHWLSGCMAAFWKPAPSPYNLGLFSRRSRAERDT